MTPLLRTCLVLFLFLIRTTFLSAQPGTLVPWFGTNGKLTDPAKKSFEKAITSQPDRKILIGSQGFYQGYNTFMIDRLMPDGSSDPSFGTSGSAFILFPDMNRSYISSQVNAIALLPDGKIVAAGYGYGSTRTIALARFTPDGMPDSSFGSNGTSLTGFYTNETVAGLAVQPDGKIVVCGNSLLDLLPGDNRFFTARYLPNGSIDESFGNKGIVISSYSGSANAVVIQADGKIAAGGYSTETDGISFHIERYAANGSYDNGFGSNGIINSRVNGGFLNFINDIALDKNGNIIAAGKINGGGVQTFTIVRYSADGSVDNSFGEDGVITNVFPGKTGEAEKIMITGENQDRIVVAGSNTGNAGGDFVVVAYNTSGLLDSIFGNQGIATTDFGGSDFDNSATLCVNGKIAALGNNFGQYPFSVRALALYNGYPLKVSLFVKVKRWLQTHNIAWKGSAAEDDVAYYGVEQSSNGITGFTQIARVSGYDHANNYSISNNHLLQGMNYYRIKAISPDGTVRYSEVASADNSVSSLSVYPNPAKDIITVNGLQTNATSTISITNGNGNVMMKGVNNSSPQHRFAISDLRQGTYYINVLTPDGKKEVATFIKQ